MKRTRILARLVVVAGIACTAVGSASAEVDTVRIARQYGIAYLPMMVIQHEKLIERYAKEAGLQNIAVKWATLAGSSVLNDALLSGSIDFAVVGPPSVIQFWDKTAGSPDEIKALAAVSMTPINLYTRNTQVRSIRDFTEKDKIALPAVKVSIQAILLQMAASQQFGIKNYTKLDSITISRAHPDAFAALMSDSSEIDSHFTAPPYSNLEEKDPRLHTVLKMTDILDGPASVTYAICSKRFHDANPKLSGAVFKAIEAAQNLIRSDKYRAAAIYLAVSKDKTPIDDIVDMLRNPDMDFTVTPQKIMRFATFMYEIGTISKRPASWKEMFFEEARGLAGS